MKTIILLRCGWLLAFSFFLLYLSAAVGMAQRTHLRELNSMSYTDMGIVPLCDSLVTAARQESDIVAVCKYSLLKGHCFFVNFRFQKAVETYDEIIQIVGNDSVGNSLLAGYRDEACLHMIKSFRYLELYDLSLDKCYELLSVSKSPGIRLFVHSFLGLSFCERFNKERGLEHFRIADALASTKKVPSVILGDYYNYKGAYYFYESKTDSALYCLDQALLCIQDSPYAAFLRDGIISNMALVYRMQGKFQQARQCYQRNMAFIKDENNNLYLRLLYYYAALCMEMQMSDSAAYYCKEAIQLSESMRSDCEIYGTSRTLYSQILYGRAEYKSAYDYFREGVEQLDSSRIMKTAEKLAVLQNEYNNQLIVKEHRNLEQRVELLKWKNRSNVYVILLLALLLLLLLFLAWWLIRKYRQNISSQRVLAETLEQKENRIIQLRGLYSSVMQSKDGESQVLAKAMMAFHDLFIQLENRLTQLESVSDAGKIKEGIRDTRQLITDGKDSKIFDTFESFFYRQYGGFREELLNQNASLTNNEKQLCMLLVMDLSTKDIAFYMNKSVRTIETMIYRLRKKFEIPSQMKTSVFFKQFLRGDRQNG